LEPALLPAGCSSWWTSSKANKQDPATVKVAGLHFFYTVKLQTLATQSKLITKVLNLQIYLLGVNWCKTVETTGFSPFCFLTASHLFAPSFDTESTQ
jgi:hypothetical protein